MRYTPRLVPPGSTPPDALVEPVIANPPPSPLGEHAQLPVVAWMVERDGSVVHVARAGAPDREELEGSALETLLEGELASEPLELPGVVLATRGRYAAELLLDRDHLAKLHELLGAPAYLAAVPRRGLLLVGGVGAGVAGMRAFVDHARRQHDEAPVDERISPIAMFVRAGAPTAAIGELQLQALAQLAG